MQYPRGVVILSAGQAARVLGVRPTTLRDWVARGHIGKRGRNRYDLGEILSYRDARRAGAVGARP